MFLHAAKDMFVYNHAPEYLVLLKILFIHANLKVYQLKLNQSNSKM